MISNLDRYRKDLDALIATGKRLEMSIQSESVPEEFREALGEAIGGKAKADAFIKILPHFKQEYQSWYSEAKALIKQLLPDRLADFVRHYEKPKPRKEITYESYRIEDYLQGLSIRRWDDEKIVGPDAAIPHFHQQLAILKAVKQRFESSLFDIRHLVQADLFDTELEAAQELSKQKFTRAAGALAGVVLERHLGDTCEKHDLKIPSKAPAISDYNNALKEAGVIDVMQWRFIQHLGDIRNLCDHDKKMEPTPAQVHDLIAGVAKIIKTVF
jgi:hypothetical protein